MKKRFTLSLTALIASAFLFVVTSFAWFTLRFLIPIDNIPGNVSGIVYDLGGDFVVNSVIYPELELISEDVSIRNFAPDTLFLRIKITYTKVDWDYVDEEYVFSSPYQEIFTDDNESSHIEVGLNSNFFYDEDGYWYYDELIQNNTITHILLTSLKYSGFKVGNEYQQKTLDIKIIIEVTTQQEGLWDPISTMEFTTTM